MAPISSACLSASRASWVASAYAHLPVVELRALFVGFGGARRDHVGADLAQHLQHHAIIVHGVGIIARRSGVLGVVGVILSL